jgi:hypothetical protein
MLLWELNSLIAVVGPNASIAAFACMIVVFVMVL